MGLIKAGLGALGGTLKDQWKDYFYCESIPNDILVVKGQRKGNNNNGNSNVISNGSNLVVADGQCMIIVENGKVLEICSEPGEFIYDTSLEPSIFTDGLSALVQETFRRFTYGGDPGKDQRIYYFNTKELVDNKFGTQNPILFRIVDNRINLDLDAEIKCNGVYSYKITNPILFYVNVCGNVANEYSREEIDNQLRTEFISALQPALAKLSDLEIRPNQIPAHIAELTDAMNKELTAKWKDLRGLEVVSVAMNPITLSEEYSDIIRDAQKMAQQAQFLSNQANAAGALAGATAEAMKAAANNPNGSMMGFMGMNMAGQATGMNAQNLFQSNNQQAQPTGWNCDCGTTNSGNFCANCGKPKPQQNSAWTCSCGTVNNGNFCANCGKPKI